MIYIVVVEDRHEDVKLYAYMDREVAIERARAIAHDHCRHETYYREEDTSMYDNDWIFFADYSSEGDSVRVDAVEVNG